MSSVQGVVGSSDEHSSVREPTELLRGADREVCHCTPKVWGHPQLHNWVYDLAWRKPGYLSKGALYPTQEVIVAGSDAVSAVDVVDFEPELLHLLEVVVQGKDLGKHRVQVALYDFCPVQLREERQRTSFCFVFYTRDSQRPPGCFQSSTF